MTITLTREEAQQVLDLMTRYRTETPLGHQPHMISHKADEAIEFLRARLSAPEPEPIQIIDGVVRPVPWTQREWQGLTDEEMSAAMDYWSDPVRSAYGGAHSADGEYVGMIDTWQYIEAKLKEKNA
jgi:hypothetical protein